LRQSLLSLVEGDGGLPRYRMLETVREYGEVRLDAAGGRDAAMAGLVAWARAHTVELAAGFIGPGQLVAFSRCAAEQDNLIAALRWSIAHDDGRRGRRRCGGAPSLDRARAACGGHRLGAGAGARRRPRGAAQLGDPALPAGRCPRPTGSRGRYCSWRSTAS
jgi:hypothetical protein